MTHGELLCTVAHSEICCRVVNGEICCILSFASQWPTVSTLWAIVYSNLWYAGS